MATPSSNVSSDMAGVSGTIYAPGDRPGGPIVRRSARLIVQPVPGSHSQSVNEAVQARPSSASADDVPAEPSISAGSKKRGRELTPTSDEEASSPSEEAGDRDDEFRESRPVKKLRLVLRAPKQPTTAQGVPPTTQGVLANTQGLAPKAPLKQRQRVKKPAAGAPRKQSKTVKNATLSSPVTKAEPHGEPPVWAEGRQALCSTVPYYNAYQSGVYHLNKFCYAVMMDKNSGSGAYLDSEVVITRAGGGSGGKNKEGTNAPTMAQNETKATVKALLNTMKNRIPVVLIIGNENQEITVVLKHMYSVMGYFIITNVWFEKSAAGVSFCKVRFEKRDLSIKSWWAPRDSPEPLPEDQRDYSTKAEVKTCVSCGEESVQIYAETWMCLKASCNSSWTVNGAPPPETITYNPAFLNERCEKGDLRSPPFALRPPLPQQGMLDVGKEGVSEEAMGGIVCPLCGGCQPRADWTGWYCETPDCGFAHELDMPVVKADSVNRPQHRFDGHAPCDTIVDDHLISINALGHWRKDVITICPGNYLTHFAANKVLNSRPGGPDDMFEEVQRASIPGLKRLPLAQSLLKGKQLTRHFTKNYGMPYKYIVAQSSETFENAPPVVMKALALLKWAGEQSISDGSQKPFNELLVLGYMESGAIGYHDDGEDTLGPTIATLSLGCSAKMFVRMKYTYYYGKSKNGNILADDPVLPGCLHYEERLKLKDLRGTLSAQDFKEHQEQVYGGISGSEKHAVCTALCVKHGDLIVMHGAEMQKYYEHSVIPDGKLRFAITSRHIIPDKIDSQYHHMGLFQIAAADVYDGN